MSDTELSPVKRALLEQRRLKARIQELERALQAPRAEPIAVIGLGCRFPGASGPDAFWRLLESGVDAITDMPADRWDVATQYDADPEAPGKIATRFGGYLTGIDQFDAHRFGISPREAATMDPQQRVLLEVTWESLEHAGLAPDTLTGASIGVFVGIGPTDYLQRFTQRGSRTDIDAYLATGNAHSVASGRIAYLLGVHGPAISVDTACSSSLVAIQLACESIRNGACESALAGGVGILLGDHNYISLSKARMMAPDGRCKAFDARANGFVRSEGCGMVVLKRLSVAQRDGDRILAVVRGGAINQDGRSNGITAPNGPAQQAVIRAAHANGGTTPAAVSYLEAHGTGTALGDPIEVESMAAVLGEGRDRTQPMYLGSVKTNIGHAEAAAGVAGFIKTVLALHHESIPPSLHFESPNPLIAWNDFPFVRVPTKVTPWNATNGPRTAGVSAFGFSGTNVHVVMEEAPAQEAPREITERPVHVLALSAKSDAALRIAAQELAAHIADATTSIGDLCFSVNTGRAALERRIALVAGSVDTLCTQLEQLAGTGAVADGRVPVDSQRTAPPVLLAFTGIDAGSIPGARTLYATQPAFRDAIERCVALCTPDGAQILRGALLDAGALSAANSVHPIVQFAISYALASVWLSWGVKGDAVLGDGVGELVALVVAGVLPLDSAIRRLDGAGAAVDASSPPQMPVFSSSRGRRMSNDEVRMAAAAGASVSPRTDLAAAARESAARDGYSAVVEMNVTEWPALATRVAELFEQGVAVNWRGFDSGYHRTRLNVPASPWMRERHWFDEHVSALAGSHRVHDTWTHLTRAALRQSGRVPADVELSTFSELWSELDAFTTRAVANAIHELGLFRTKGERHTVATAMAAGHVLPLYRHLLSLWLKRLAAAGMLTQDGDEFVAMGERGIVTPERGSFGPRSASIPLLCEYLLRCERGMARIITGHESALETLFPGGSFETADFLYRHWGLARYHSGILEAVSDALVERADGRPLRILEVGAGTAATTATLLPLFNEAGAEYWFTDISEFFFPRAEREFEGCNVRFHRFDIDQPPAAQQLPSGYFDLIVGSNVVHASKDIARALDHVRALLAPGGVLLLYEVTTHLAWFEMSTALIEGWQHHIDELRGETPLLSPEQWEAALRAHGFDRVASYPPANSPASVLGHQVVMASAPGVASVSAAQAPATARVAKPAPVIATAAAPATASASAPATAPAAPAIGASPIRERLLALTTGERTEVLREVVQRQVAGVMRLRPSAPLPSPDDRLMSIGMDSLMAVELRKKLAKELDDAVTLPSTLIFDHPTIDAIVAFILASLGLNEPVVKAEETPDSQRENKAAAIAGLSEAEVEALLLEQLKGL